MKNVKKWLAIGLSAVMLVGVTACGNENPGSSSQPANNNESQESNTGGSSQAQNQQEEKEPVLLEWYYRAMASRRIQIR